MNHGEALKEEVWRKALLEELNSIERNQTWQLITTKQASNRNQVDFQSEIEHKWVNSQT